MPPGAIPSDTPGHDNPKGRDVHVDEAVLDAIAAQGVGSDIGEDFSQAGLEKPIQGPPQAVVVQHLGGDTRPDQKRKRLVGEELRSQIQGPAHKAREH